MAEEEAASSPPASEEDASPAVARPSDGQVSPAPPAPEPIKEAALQLASSEPKVVESADPGVFRRFWRWVWKRRNRPQAGDTTSSRLLENLLAEESLTWKTEGDRTRSLFYLFRAKHEEARVYANTENTVAHRLASRATVILYVVLVLLLLAYGAIVYAILTKKEVDWHLLAATSGTILLSIGIATLVYRVSERFSKRAQCYTDDADETRRVEAAVRLTLLAGDDKAAPSMHAFAMRLLDREKRPADPTPELSAVPELVKEVAEATTKLVASVKSKPE